MDRCSSRGKCDWDDDYHPAVEELSKAIELEPNHTEALYRRAHLSYRLYLGYPLFDRIHSDYLRVMDDLNKVIQVDPGYWKAYNLRGIAYNEGNSTKTP